MDFLMIAAILLPASGLITACRDRKGPAPGNVSGNWQGTITPQDPDDKASVKVEAQLQQDGQGHITGTILLHDSQGEWDALSGSFNVSGFAGTDHMWFSTPSDGGLHVTLDGSSANNTLEGVSTMQYDGAGGLQWHDTGRFSLQKQ
jgi:hypothetical protein